MKKEFCYDDGSTLKPADQKRLLSFEKDLIKRGFKEHQEIIGEHKSGSTIYEVIFTDDRNKYKFYKRDEVKEMIEPKPPDLQRTGYYVYDHYKRIQHERYKAQTVHICNNDLCSGHADLRSLDKLFSCDNIIQTFTKEELFPKKPKVPQIVELYPKGEIIKNDIAVHALTCDVPFFMYFVNINLPDGPFELVKIDDQGLDVYTLRVIDSKGNLYIQVAVMRNEMLSYTLEGLKERIKKKEEQVEKSRAQLRKQPYSYSFGHKLDNQEEQLERMKVKANDVEALIKSREERQKCSK